jgi:Mn-dependent DtxR family transcriptional regulator
MHAVQALHLSTPTVTKAVNNLERLGLVEERTGKGKNRIYAYTEYLRILSAETEPL